MYSQFRTNLHLVPITDNAIGKHFLRYSIFAWGIPGILLGASVVIQYREKGGKILDTSSLKQQNCWFLDDNAFIYGLLVPSSILTIFTLFYLIQSALVSHYVISMQVDRKVREKMRRKRTLQIVLFTKITFLLIIVIILGALTKLIKSDPLWITYHVGQGLQGIFIAMLVTCNCQVLKLYTRSFKSRTGSCGSVGSSSKHPSSYGNIVPGARSFLSKGTAISKSTSLQLLTWDPTPDPV
ncbi:7 transmembrane receptor (Secretin family) [Popillia japonica]|uniref:7 transmembrane receptor (Secretin family) n=1 Tax=Popillia japonica TaxID=7064 RepID=A0AAW1LR64_POPJA